MNTIKLSLDIDEDHPSYQWAKRQSDIIAALGHIGTHLDAYTKVPDSDYYQIDCVAVDCSTAMPESSDIEHLDLEKKALVLYTANLEKNGYGNPAYGATLTHLNRSVLDYILSKKPSFFVIDSYGIGAHGEEHITFDKLCEMHDCFVIENVVLNKDFVFNLKQLEFRIDLNSSSSGKQCHIVGIVD